MNPTSVLRPPYVAYFSDFTRFRSWLWAAAFVASILVHSFVVWRASVYVPRVPPTEIRVDVRMIKEEPPPPPPPPPPKPVEPPPPPPPPKPVPKPPKPVPQQAPLPVLAAPAAPSPAPEERVVPVQPPPAPLPPIDAPPPPPAPAPVPAPTPAPAAPSVDFQSLKAGYGQALSAEIKKGQTYPRLAAMRGLEGTPKVLIVIENGQLVSATLVDESGQSVLDEAALALVKKTKLPPVPAALAGQRLEFLLPIDYKLKK